MHCVGPRPLLQQTGDITIFHIVSSCNHYETEAARLCNHSLYCIQPRTLRLSVESSYCGHIYLPMTSVNIYPTLDHFIVKDCETHAVVVPILRLLFETLLVSYYWVGFVSYSRNPVFEFHLEIWTPWLRIFMLSLKSLGKILE